MRSGRKLSSTGLDLGVRTDTGITIEGERCFAEELTEAAWCVPWGEICTLLHQPQRRRDIQVW